MARFKQNFAARFQNRLDVERALYAWRQLMDDAEPADNFPLGISLSQQFGRHQRKTLAM